MMKYEVRVKEVAAQPIVSIRDIVPMMELVAFFDDAVKELHAYIERVGGRAAGPAFSMWHSPPMGEPPVFDIETVQPTAQELPSKGSIRAGTLPRGLLAYTIHEGSYDNMSNAFDAVANWIENSEYEMAGPSRDVVLVGSNDVEDSSQWRTEIAWLIRPRTQARG